MIFEVTSSVCRRKTRTMTVRVRLQAAVNKRPLGSTSFSLQR